MATPREAAIIRRLQRLTQSVAKILATYKQRLEEEGMHPSEAWAMAQRLEKRLLGPAFAEAEAAMNRPERESEVPCPECYSPAVDTTPLESGSIHVCLACMNVWGTDGG